MTAARAVVLAAVSAGALAGATPARAGIVPAHWLSIGAIAGATRFDDHLADYQWRVDPRAEWGGQAMAGIGPFGAGVRATRAQTAQRIDQADVSNPAVRATRVELVASGRLLSLAGVSLEAIATTGRLHLGYAPDHVSIATSGGATDVALAPIDTWTSGLGLAVGRAIAGPWRGSAEVGAESFTLDTAHRSGSTIVMRNERFSEWSARFESARIFGTH